MGKLPDTRRQAGIHAGADESLISYLRRMQPSQASVSEPGIADAAAEVGTEIGQQVLPYYAQEMAGIAKPLHSYPQDFPEMGEFRQRVEAALDRPVIREGERLMSPAEYAAREIFGDDVSPQQVAMSRQIMAGQLSGEQPNQALAGPIKNTLLQLRKQGIGGPEAQFAGQTLAQREARRTSPLQDGRYITSPGLDANLAATRAYNVLSAMQTDPEITPPTADMASGILPLVGAALTNPLGQPNPDPNDITSWDQFYNRSIASIANPARSRALEAIANERLAEQGETAGEYRNALKGGWYPQTSWTSGVGMSRQAMDNANLNSYLSETLLPQAFSFSPVVGTDKSPMIRQLAGDLLREVPIVPEGASQEEVESAQQKMASYFGSQEDQFKHDYPIYQRSWNDAMDNLGEAGLGKLATGMKVDKFSYPSPLLNSVATAPKYWLDPVTLGTLGAALPFSMAKGTAIPMLRAMVKDFVMDQRFEQPFAMGLHMSQEPYKSSPGNLLSPYEGALEVDGRKVDANDPDYELLRAKHKDQQKKLLGDAVQSMERYYRPGGTTPPQR